MPKQGVTARSPDPPILDEHDIEVGLKKHGPPSGASQAFSHTALLKTEIMC